MNVQRPQNDIVEIFGYAPNDTSTVCRSLWTLGACPFVETPCSKSNHDKTIVYGTCSVTTRFGDCVICPNRLYANHFATLKEVSADAFGDVPFYTYQEYIQHRSDPTACVVALGMHSGHTKQELQDKGDAMAEYVQKQFENEFSSYKTMIGNVNAEVTSFNSGLTASAMSLLEKRKKKADSFSAINNALQIPLTASKNAPNTKPIQLKRIVRQSSAKPTVKTAIPEPCISDSDYENINNIILMCGTTMEKTARTYFANTEEELRDHLLATLNTHYESATGETFRKIGKTDIHIEFENKAAFIGECKIWHGERLFQGAIQQVINYSTWRDMKVSVIIFNKENQSFPAIISKIKSWADSNTVSYTQPQANIWKCKYHRQDMNVDIQLMILAFDLYVDKSQFKDSRYEN